MNKVEPGIENKLITVALNPRDKAYIALLTKCALSISETIQIDIGDINFEEGALSITSHKERMRLKCPDCGEYISKRNAFCPTCGEKIDRIAEERIDQLRQRVIPLDTNTLNLLDNYLRWRHKFSYQGTLLFPISRQRGWQLAEKIGRRAGIKGLCPDFLRKSFIKMWLGKKLDTRVLQVFLGKITLEQAGVDFEQMKQEYNKLWENINNGKQESGDEQFKPR